MDQAGCCESKRPQSKHLIAWVTTIEFSLYKLYSVLYALPLTELKILAGWLLFLLVGSLLLHLAVSLIEDSFAKNLDYFIKF